MKILLFVLLFLILLSVCYYLVIKYDSVELDPESPFFNDEIESEGYDKVKIK